jgi:hypothetical protein
MSNKEFPTAEVNKKESSPKELVEFNGMSR